MNIYTALAFGAPWVSSLHLPSELRSLALCLASEFMLVLRTHWLGKDVNSVIFIQSVILFPLPVSGDTRGHSPWPIWALAKSSARTLGRSPLFLQPVGGGGWCCPCPQEGSVPGLPIPPLYQRWTKCSAALFRERGYLPCPVMCTFPPPPHRIQGKELL